MLSKTIGNVIVHFEPLIIFGGLIAIILLVQMARSIIIEKRFTNVYKNLIAGKYDDVIEIGANLLYSYKKYNARLSTKPITNRIEYLNFALSVSYFAKFDDDQFLSHINALIVSLDVKEFWLSLYYLRRDDFDSFQSHYANIKVSDETLLNRTYLESIRLYMRNQYDLAKMKMMGIYTDLKHPVLKQIADEVLKSEN